ncbi:MAG: sigma-70 family RNA polymerase sigma factor [Steroidobacteraceae bacterium]
MEAQPVSLPASAGGLSEPPAPAGGTGGRTASLETALARAQRGELAAFRELIRTYQDTVYTLALRMLKVREDAEDLAQDVFVSVHRHLGEIVSEAHLLFWLRRTTCHRAIDRLRRRWPYPSVPLDAVTEPAAAETNSDPLLERSLRDLIARLPPTPRAVVLLRYQEDLDPPDIAQTLGMPLNTVKSHLKRSLALLRRRGEELRLPICAGEPS